MISRAVASHRLSLASTSAHLDAQSQWAKRWSRLNRSAEAGHATRIPVGRHDSHTKSRPTSLPASYKVDYCVSSFKVGSSCPRARSSTWFSAG